MFNLDEIYTVSNFLALCNKTIENHIPICWLQGEISNLSRPASGHWYFSLKDNKGQIRCALFRLNQRNVKFQPENGMAVLARVAPTLYEARGDFQLIIQHVEPVGVGSFQLAFEQLKNKLKDEGLFGISHKKPLPIEVNTIGVISSSNGAVIRDIIKVLNKRYPFATILLFDTPVQGDGAAEKIVRALTAADKSGRCEVLILARGGGSIEDLWVFNEEILARAIFVATTPIISAIGHETDTTIADFVSDIRAPTPSAAAMLATPDRLALLAKLNKLSTNLSQSNRQILNNYQQKLKQLTLQTPRLERQIHLLSQQLDGLITHLNHQVKALIRLNHNKLHTVFEQLKQHSPSANIQHKKQLAQIAQTQLNHNIKRHINQQKNTLDHLRQRLNKSVTQLTQWQQNTLATYVRALTHLSPLNTLSRGYSITTLENNQVLHSASAVKIGASITTLLKDGKIYACVKKIKKN